MRLYALWVLCIPGLLAMPPAYAVAEGVDCGACHDEAPVPAGHMPVADVSAEVCFLCHDTGPDDGLFVTVHAKHSEAGVDCSRCHGDAANETLRQTPDGVLGP